MGGMIKEMLDKNVTPVSAPLCKSFIGHFADDDERCSDGFALAVSAIKLKEQDGAFYPYRRVGIFKTAGEYKPLINDLPDSLLAIDFE